MPKLGGCRYLVRFLFEAFESNGDVIRSFAQAREVHHAALGAVEPFPKVLCSFQTKLITKIFYGAPEKEVDENQGAGTGRGRVG